MQTQAFVLTNIGSAAQAFSFQEVSIAPLKADEVHRIRGFWPQLCRCYGPFGFVQRGASKALRNWV